MKFSKSLLLALVACAGIVYALYEDDSPVNQLTEATFDEFAESHSAFVAEFYAPWCGHCKKLAPEYNAAAEVNGDAFAAVDCTENSDLCAKYGVSGYPTLKFFRDGKPQEYTGGRNKDDLLAFYDAMTGEIINKVASAEELDSILAEKDFVVLSKFAAGDDYDSFEKAAYQNMDKSFVVVENEELASSHGLNDENIIVVKMKGDDDVTFAAERELTDSSISDFVAKEAVPLVSMLTQKNVRDIASGDQTVFITFVNKDEEEATAEITDLLRKVAPPHRGLLRFLTADATEFERAAEAYGLKGVVPSGFIFNFQSKEQYVFPTSDEFSEENLSSFTGRWANGELTMTLKSAAVPETQDEAVRVIVGDSFHKEVIEAEKSVFVKFYAPWCGHCKKLAPIWDELAENYADDDSVEIAKFDMTENDAHPKYDIRGFPTLIFFPKGSKNAPITYKGERELEELTDFVEEHK